MAKRPTSKPRSQTLNSKKKTAQQLPRWVIVVGLVAIVAIIGIVVVRLSFASEEIDIIYKEAKEALNAVKGNNEGVTKPCKAGSSPGRLTGWAFDPLKPGQSIQVHLYFDPPGGFPTVINANLPSGDVRAAFPEATGANRFSFDIPAQYYDGHEHSIAAYGIGTSGNPFLGQIYFTCYPADAPPPPPPTQPPKNPPTPKVNPENPGKTIKTDPARPADPAVVKTVLAQLSLPLQQSGSSSKNGGSGTNSRSTNPTQLVTVDLLDISKDLSAADLLAIDQKIDEIKPEALQTISGTVVLKPNISDNKGVVMVGYYLNKRLAYYSTKAPYDFDFDTRRFENGAYRLDVVGFDKDGNQVTRLVQKFNIQNNLNFFDRLYNLVTSPIYRIDHNL